MNLFIGVIFIKFGDAQKEELEQTHLNVDQLKWIDMLKMIIQAKPDMETTTVPVNPFRKKMHRFVTGAFYEIRPGDEKKINKFEIFIMIFIILNMFLLCATYEGSSNSYNNILTYLNYAFTIVFVFEATCKLTAFGVYYFSSSWNVFDFFIVSTSVLDISLGFLNAQALGVFKIGP